MPDPVRLWTVQPLELPPTVKDEALRPVTAWFIVRSQTRVVGDVANAVRGVIDTTAGASDAMVTYPVAALVDVVTTSVAPARVNEPPPPPPPHAFVKTRPPPPPPA